MARRARGNNSYGVKPSSYFYASVEVYLSTFQIAEWYGYGKASADSPMYYAGQYSGDLATGVNAYANMIGMRTLVTSPAFWKFELSKSYSKEITITSADVTAFYLDHRGTRLQNFGARLSSVAASFKRNVLRRGSTGANLNAGGTDTQAAGAEAENQAPPTNLLEGWAINKGVDDAADATMVTQAQLIQAAIGAAVGAASQVLVTSAIRGAEETDNSRTRRQGEKEAEAAEEEEAEEENGDE